MDKIRLEKALLAVSFDILINLSTLNRKNKTNKKKGYIYTCFKNEDHSVKIGYTEIINDVKGSLNSSGYILGKVKFAKNDPSALFIIDNELNIN